MASSEYFATVAEQWDELRAGFFPESLRVKALVAAGAQAGRTAADLGAGTGFVTQALLDAGLTVFAVDQSPAMLAELRARFPGADQQRRLHVLEAEAERLPLPDASVDCVFANMLLHHVDDPARAIGEMARTLKPGGRLVITDLDLHARRELLDEQHDRWPGFAREDVARWLEAAGLDAVAVDACGERCCVDTGCAASRYSAVPTKGCASVDSASAAPRAGVSIFLACGRKPLLGIRPCQADADAVGRRARALFDASPNLLCAESVFLALAEGLGVESPLVPRLATGFCSGLARTDGLCGAFNGGVLGLGLALGRDTGQDGLDRAYAAVQAFRGCFLERFGHDGCTHICGCSLNTDEGRLAFGPSGAKARCLNVVEWAAAQALRILRNS
ncbi:C-GCAxxG-C-C family (seleno)protein [Humidesulfovibrio sp.]